MGALHPSAAAQVGVPSGAANKLAQERMERPARQGADVRLEPRQHVEAVRGQLEDLGASVSAVASITIPPSTSRSTSSGPGP